MVHHVEQGNIPREVFGPGKVNLFLYRRGAKQGFERFQQRGRAPEHHLDRRRGGFRGRAHRLQPVNAGEGTIPQEILCYNITPDIRLDGSEYLYLTFGNKGKNYG